MEHGRDPSLENVRRGFFDARLPPRLKLYRADQYEIATKLHISDRDAYAASGARCCPCQDSSCICAAPAEMP